MYHEGRDVEMHVDIASRIRKTRSTLIDYKASRVNAKNLLTGHLLQGCVVKVDELGSFIDVGADRDAWLPKGQMDPSSLSVGQELQVEAIRFQVDGVLCVGKVIAWGDSQARSLAKLQSVPSSEWLSGTVVDTKPYGLMVDVRVPGSRFLQRGLVHASELREGYVEDATKEAEVGAEVQVRVLEVDPKISRIACSMREDHSSIWRSGTQDLSEFARLPLSTWLPGVVERTAPFGLFVGVKPPIGSGQRVQGLVHSSCIREGFVEDPASEAKVGEEVKVRVMNLDLAGGRMLLTMKG